LTALLLSHPHAHLLAPSSRIALIVLPFATRRRVALPSPCRVAPHHVSPSLCHPRQVTSVTSPLTTRHPLSCCPRHVAFVASPCHVTPHHVLPSSCRPACLLSLASDLWRKWRGVNGWGGSASAGSRVDYLVVDLVDYLCGRLSIQSDPF
jgi:hypothetical protein